MTSFDEDDSEWNSSKIKGFTFGDDEETPWAELSKYQTISETASGGQDLAANSVISFDPVSSAASSAASGLVSDRVKKAVRIYAGTLPEIDGLSITEGNESYELVNIHVIMMYYSCWFNCKWCWSRFLLF